MAFRYGLLLMMLYLMECQCRPWGIGGSIGGNIGGTVGGRLGTSGRAGIYGGKTDDSIAAGVNGAADLDAEGRAGVNGGINAGAYTYDGTGGPRKGIRGSVGGELGKTVGVRVGTSGRADGRVGANEQGVTGARFGIAPNVEASLRENIDAGVSGNLETYDDSNDYYRKDGNRRYSGYGHNDEYMYPNYRYGYRPYEGRGY